MEEFDFLVFLGILRNSICVNNLSTREGMCTTSLDLASAPGLGWAGNPGTNSNFHSYH